MSELHGLKIEFNGNDKFTAVAGSKEIDIAALKDLFLGMGIETEIEPVAGDGDYQFRSA